VRRQCRLRRPPCDERNGHRRRNGRAQTRYGKGTHDQAGTRSAPEHDLERHRFAKKIMLEQNIKTLPDSR
jgi:hypothetical protein